MSQVPLQYLFDYKLRLIKVFHHFMRLTFFSLVYRKVWDTQSFLGYVLLTKPSFCIIFPFFSITCLLRHRRDYDERQLQWCEHYCQDCQLNAKRATNTKVPQMLR